jgi:hypothetical protein
MEFIGKSRATRRTGRLSWKGIVIGSIADIGGSSIWGVFFVAYIVSVHHLGTLPSAQITSAVQQVMHANAGLYVLNLIVGGAFSILGGYIAASIAKHDELLNGALSAMLCVLSGIYGIFAMNSGQPRALDLLFLPLSPLLGLSGGFVRSKRKEVT